MTLDATKSCPLDVGMHSTLGGIDLNVSPSNILFSSIKRNEKLPHVCQSSFLFSC